MTAPLRKLVDLSRLRAETARRAAARAHGALVAAEAALEQAKRDEAALRERMARRREAVRRVFVGDARSRPEVERLLGSLSATRREESEAGARVAAAQKALAAAAAALKTARAELGLRQRTLLKRESVATTLIRAERRLKEIRHEAEVEDSFAGFRHGGDGA